MTRIFSERLISFAHVLHDLLLTLTYHHLLIQLFFLVFTFFSFFSFLFLSCSDRFCEREERGDVFGTVITHTVTCAHTKHSHEAHIRSTHKKHTQEAHTNFIFSLCLSLVSNNHKHILPVPLIHSYTHLLVHTSTPSPPPTHARQATRQVCPASSSLPRTHLLPSESFVGAGIHTCAHTRACIRLHARAHTRIHIKHTTYTKHAHTHTHTRAPNTCQHAFLLPLHT